MLFMPFQLIVKSFAVIVSNYEIIMVLDIVR